MPRPLPPRPPDVANSDLIAKKRNAVRRCCVNHGAPGLAMKMTQLRTVFTLIACCGLVGVGCNGDDDAEEADAGHVVEAGEGAADTSVHDARMPDVSVDTGNEGGEPVDASQPAVDADGSPALVDATPADGANKDGSGETSDARQQGDGGGDATGDDGGGNATGDAGGDATGDDDGGDATADDATSDGAPTSDTASGDSALMSDTASGDSALMSDSAMPDSPSEAAGATLRVCIEACAVDEDCARPGVTRWSCDPVSHMCKSCYDDLICIAGVSMWTSKKCTADNDCFRCNDGGCTHFFGDYCIEVDHTGYCAFDKDSTSCTGLPTPQVVKRFGSADTVQVCSKTTSRCDAERGYCITACRSNGTCSPARGGNTCDLATGRCQCEGPQDCGADAPVCNSVTKQCECDATDQCSIDGGRARVCHQ
jgi:hypothetical protein